MSLMTGTYGPAIAPDGDAYDPAAWARTRLSESVRACIRKVASAVSSLTAAVVEHRHFESFQCTSQFWFHCDATLCAFTDHYISTIATFLQTCLNRREAMTLDGFERIPAVVTISLLQFVAGCLAREAVNLLHLAKNKGSRRSASRSSPRLNSYIIPLRDSAADSSSTYTGVAVTIVNAIEVSNMQAIQIHWHCMQDENSTVMTSHLANHSEEADMDVMNHRIFRALVKIVSQFTTISSI